MLRYLFLSCLLTTLFISVAQSQQETSASAISLSPSAKNLKAWRRHILPTDDEQAFEKISWRPDFITGLKEARQKKLPLLFYAMNGHPLGCT